jgi:hypothetical protein
LIDLSFLPQILAAVWIYTAVMNDSYLLIKTSLRVAFFLAFAEIILFAILTAVKRFYLFRFLLLGAYVQLIVTMFITGFSGDLMLYGTLRWYETVPAGTVFAIFATCGVLLTLINLTAFYGLKKAKEKLTQ